MPRPTVATISVLLGTISLSSSASAAEYRAREISGWTITETTNGDACLMGMDYEGDGTTSVMLSLNPEGENRLIVTNYNWSIKDDEKLELDFELSNGVYGKHPAIGVRSGSKGGFGTFFEPNFPTYFAQSRYLRINREGGVIDRLSLNGTGAAVAELRRCAAVIKARAQAEAREKAR